TPYVLVRSFQVVWLFVVVVAVAPLSFFLFFFTDPPTTEIYTLSLHDALPIYRASLVSQAGRHCKYRGPGALIDSGRLWHRGDRRSEEHTSELQSRSDLVCRLLLEKKKKRNISLGVDSRYHVSRAIPLTQCLVR